MRERGFSLVELIIVLCLIATLSTIATLRFNEYMLRSRKESQTRTIHAELMQARLHALTERRGRRVKLYRESFEVYSSSVDDEKGAEPVLRVPLAFPIVWNRDGANDIDIDERGVVDLVDVRSICQEEVGGELLDSVVVYTTKVSLGSRKEGGACEKGGISVR